MALPAALRNRLAGLILEAFDAPEARGTLAALDAFCRSADGRVGLEAASRLVGLGWFEAEGSEAVRLLRAHRPHREALCRRAAAAHRIAGASDAATGVGTLPGLLARAAMLADAGLFFEVHELLEAVWFRADGERRVALQGLIQIAVALHHAENQNREGAISLLTEGLSKLATCGAALPLEMAGFMRELATVLTVLAGGAAIPPAPPWPAPPAAPVPKKAPWPSS